VKISKVSNQIEENQYSNCTDNMKVIQVEIEPRHIYCIARSHASKSIYLAF